MDHSLLLHSFIISDTLDRFVKLISSDGHEFIVKREDALTSGTIKAMLSGPGQFSENETNEVNFREIPSHVLQKVCMYFTYKVRFTNTVPVGSRVRLMLTFKDFEDMDGNGVKITGQNVIAIAGQDRPALVAETISILYA